MAVKFLDLPGLTRFKQLIDKVFAPIKSPTFTGTPRVPTAAAGTKTTQVASTAFVSAAIAAQLDEGLASAAETIEQWIAMYNGYMGTSLNWRDYLSDHTISDVLTEMDAMNTTYLA